MAFLREQLDDPAAAPCGRCGPCTGTSDPVTLDPTVVRAAVELLRGVDRFTGDRFDYDEKSGIANLRGNVRGVIQPRRP